MKKAIYITSGVNTAGGYNPSVGLNTFAAVSLYLNEEVDKLTDFISRVIILSNESFVHIMSAKSQNERVVTKTHITFSDKSMIFFRDLENDTFDWTLLIELYAVFSSFKSNQAEVTKRIRSFCDSKLLDQATNRQAFNMYVNNIRSLIYNKKETFSYFSPISFEKTLKKAGVKYSIDSDRIVLQFDDILIGNDDVGHMSYKNIYLFISDWSIDAYTLRFDDFDYTSKWDIKGVILHPYLSVPYLFNSVLDNDIFGWFDYQNYDLFLDMIIGSVYAKDYISDAGFASMDDIVRIFHRCKKLWNHLKHEEKQRIKLSQRIFQEITR